MSTNSSQLSTLRVIRYAHALFSGVMIVLLFLLMITTYVVTGVRVDGHSMDTTLKNGQLLIVSPAAYYFSRPQKGDIVVLNVGADNSVRIVKRIAAVPGQLVEYQDKVILLGNDEYFILGDNPPESTDSREFGPVKLSNIYGKVLNAH